MNAAGEGSGYLMLQGESGAFGTNALPLTAVPSRENGLNPAADPSPGSLCTLRMVMGGVFK